MSVNVIVLLYCGGAWICTVLAVGFTSANQDFDQFLVMSDITIFLQFGFTSVLECPGLC